MNIIHGDACLNNKRKCILIEKNQEYYNYIVNRFEK